MKLKALIVLFLMGSMSLMAQKAISCNRRTKNCKLSLRLVTIFVFHLHTMGLKSLPLLRSP